MMTTFAAIFGTLPIALGTGAGAELRQPLGVAVVGGLCLSQLLTLYITPVVYIYLDRIDRLLKRRLEPQLEERAEWPSIRRAADRRRGGVIRGRDRRLSTGRLRACRPSPRWSGRRRRGAAGRPQLRSRSSSRSRRTRWPSDC